MEKITMAKENKTMLTDLYQLTMNAAYFGNDKDDVATFDLFIRKLPQDWGYFIANGIEDALDYMTNLKFEAEDIDYLRGQKMFTEEFLDFLKDFKFEGDVYAVKEGTPIFSNEPIMRITAKRTQAQFVETALLNMINFQTMIATKANRVVNAAGKAKVVDFGLRRAQEEDGAMKGARACYVGGCVATSNVKAGQEYGIPISGTHAHSFVMSFPQELDAFRAYAKVFPNTPTLLIDTYDTLQGARNAAIVAKELEKQGKKLGAVRLDSGNLEDLAKKVRIILNEEGLDYVKILASNDLNEYKIDALLRANAPIDGFGVGTEMITAKPTAAIPGVYKLVEDNDGAKIKLSQEKKTLPGKKQVYRQTDDDGKYAKDIIALEGETVEGKPLLELMIAGGKRITEKRNLPEIRKYCLDEVAKLSDELKQLNAAGKYTLEVAAGLDNAITALTARYGINFATK
jgi:nicotinate phosphoribosyltransferase